MLQALFAEEGAGGAVTAPTRVFPLTAFQEEAVRRLRAIMGRWGGAILADAVGLGKTFVALALIQERLRAGGDVVVVVPAALRRLWRNRLRRVARRARRRAEGAGWRLVSHAQLSRGAAIRAPTGRRLVVVDEAHRFRNPATLRYGALAQLIRPIEEAAAVDVLLVTATPINNAVEDLYHLVRLFLPDTGLRDAGVPGLRGAFGPDAPAARRATVVRELVVRRTRRLVGERFGGLRMPLGSGDAAGRETESADGSRAPAVRFPERAAPRVVRYVDGGVRARVAAIEALELMAYADGAAPLIRLGLLKRMDSSAAALRLSLERLRAFLEACSEAAQAGLLLRPRERPPTGDGDPLQLALLGVVAGPAPPDVDLAALVASAARDLATIRGLAATPGVTPGNPRPAPTDGPMAADAKAAALAELLRSVGAEKVVVFTEYRDTAQALWRALAPRFRVGRVDGAGAWLGQRKAGRRVVIERFAPTANGRPAPRDRERVDVLIATDVLAEGLDLQDARHVVSYDLPWNPVRLLQRIGRVDRLGSSHDVVVPHLFVPADGLDAVLGLTRRLRAKLDGIAATLGEDQADALLDGLAAGRAPAVDAALEAAETAHERDPFERLRTAWAHARHTDALRPGSGDDPPAAPADSLAGTGATLVATIRVTTDHPAAELEAVALSVSGRSARLLELPRGGAVRATGCAAATVLLQALETDTAPAGRTPEPEPDAAGAARVARDVLRRLADHAGAERLAAEAPRPLARHDPESRLARLIRSAVAHAGSSLEPDLPARADAVLAALQTPTHPTVRSAVSRCVAEFSRPAPVPRLLVAAAERAVGGQSTTPQGARDPSWVPALLRVAMIEPRDAGS